MGPILAVKLYFQRALNVTGRSRRSEFVWVFLFQIVFSLLLGSLIYSFGINGDFGLSEDYGDDIFNALGLVLATIYGLFVLANFVPWITLSVRRFHHMDHTGWLVALFMGLYLIPPVGFIGGIIQFLWLFLGSGTAGNNKYGQDPRHEFRYAFD